MGMGITSAGYPVMGSTVWLAGWLAGIRPAVTVDSQQHRSGRKVLA